MELQLKEEVYQLVGAALQVYNHLGAGFLEPVYQEALALELQDCGFPFQVQKRMPIHYKGRLLEKQYFIDFLVFDQLLVEIKALDKLGPKEEAQLLNYLKAAGGGVGVLVNFGCKDKLEWKRMIWG